jgi:hypothetical protein
LPLWGLGRVVRVQDRIITFRRHYGFEIYECTLLEWCSWRLRPVRKPQFE